MLIMTIVAVWFLFLGYVALRVALYWAREYERAYQADYDALKEREQAIARLPEMMAELKAEKMKIAEEKARERNRLKAELKEITSRVNTEEKAERERIAREKKAESDKLKADKRVERERLKAEKVKKTK